MTETTIEKRANRRKLGMLIAEMVLIVLSILLAFALDSWWDEQQDRRDEQAILGALQDEFRATQQVVTEYNGLNDEAIDCLESFLEAIQAGSWQNEETVIDLCLAYLILVPTPDAGSGVLNALISSGRIEILQSGALRIRLAQWASIFDELLDDLVPSKGFAYDTVIPYLIDKGIPVISAFDAIKVPPAREGVPRESLADNPQMLADLLEDPSFRSIVEIRLGIILHAQEEYRIVQQEIETILEMLGSELSAR